MIRLEIISPEKEILSADVSRVELPGICGRFVVLDMHAPLITALNEGKVCWNEDESITIKGGFVQVKDNVVRVLVEQ